MTVMFVKTVVDTSQVILFVTVVPQHGVKLPGLMGSLPVAVVVVLGVIRENGTFQDVTVDVGGGDTADTTKLDGSGNKMVGMPASESVDGPLI